MHKSHFFQRQFRALYCIPVPAVAMPGNVTPGRAQVRNKQLCTVSICPRAHA